MFRVVSVVSMLVVSVSLLLCLSSGGVRKVRVTCRKALTSATVRQGHRRTTGGMRVTLWRTPPRPRRQDRCGLLLLALVCSRTTASPARISPLTTGTGKGVRLRSPTPGQGSSTSRNSSPTQIAWILFTSTASVSAEPSSRGARCTGSCQKAAFCGRLLVVICTIRDGDGESVRQAGTQKLFGGCRRSERSHLRRTSGRGCL